ARDDERRRAARAEERRIRAYDFVVVLHLPHVVEEDAPAEEDAQVKRSPIHAPVTCRPVRYASSHAPPATICIPIRRSAARAELVRSALPGRIVFSPAFSGCRKIHPGR